MVGFAVLVSNPGGLFTGDWLNGVLVLVVWGVGFSGSVGEVALGSGLSFQRDSLGAADW